MQVTSFDNAEERLTLSGMVTDNAVVAALSSKWPLGGFFRSRWANLVGEWCVGYSNNYGAAPGANIKHLFEAWAATGQQDPGIIDMMQRFLGGLSAEWSAGTAPPPSGYVLDVAAKHLNVVRLEKLTDAVKGALAGGRLEEAEQLWQGTQRIEVGNTGAVDIFNDDAAMQAAYEEKEGASLIEWDGALAEMFGDSFDRDQFVAFMAPEKRGKTNWLMEVTWQAAKQNRRVAFFAAGDMSQRQTIRRFGCRAARRPRLAETVKIPTELVKNPDGRGVRVSHIEDHYPLKMKWEDSQAACRRLMRGRTGGPYINLWTYANTSLKVTDIDAELKTYGRRGWVPDLVVVDYADILAPPGPGDVRDQINMNWKLLKKLSQDWHCCVVTATQTDAASYEAHTLTKSHFSEDKRKFAHVSAMFGINQTESEKTQGVQRINCLARRDGEFFETRCVTVAGIPNCYAPAILSIS